MYTQWRECEGVIQIPMYMLHSLLLQTTHTVSVCFVEWEGVKLRCGQQYPVLGGGFESKKVPAGKLGCYMRAFFSCGDCFLAYLVCQLEIQRRCVRE